MMTSRDVDLESVQTTYRFVALSLAMPLEVTIERRTNSALVTASTPLRW